MPGKRAIVAVLLIGLPLLLLAGAWPLVRRYLAGTAAAPAAPRSAPRPWTPFELAELLRAVRRADGEGLRASDYRVDELRRAVDGRRSGAGVDALANGAALSLAHDFAAGRVRNRHRFNWYIDYAGPGPAGLERGLADARAAGRLSGWLDGLLPAGPAYAGLRDALASAPDRSGRRDRIRANMERWRWLPRDFGRADRLYVNLPTYRLQVEQGGTVRASYKAVIGATDMPTPVLSAAVQRVIANPDWIVPRSIVQRSHLRPGGSGRYVFVTRPDGTVRVRQKPGPGNALGRVKIVFPNAHAIYFHDTPSKSLFGVSARTFSHGCVRVEGIAALAASIVARPDRFATALAGDRTRSFAPARAWRADIVYLTLVPDGSGGLADLGDPYAMDGRLAAALDGRKFRQATSARAGRAAGPPPAARPRIAPSIDRSRGAVDAVVPGDEPATANAAGTD